MKSVLFVLSLCCALPALGFEDESFETETALADSESALEEARLTKQRLQEEKRLRAARIQQAKTTEREARALEAAQLKVARDHETEIKKIQAENKALLKEIKASEKERARAQKLIDRSHAKIAAAEKGLENLRLRKDGIDGQIRDLRNQQAKIQADIDKGMQSAAEQEQDGARLIEQLEKEKQKLTQQKAAYQKALRDVGARRMRQTRIIEGHRKQIATERAEVEELRLQLQQKETGLLLSGR